MTFLTQLAKRRSIYCIGNNIDMHNNDLEHLILQAIRLSPSSFNSQSSRAVILFDQSHLKFWDMVFDRLSHMIPAEALPRTKSKIECFSMGKGTVLFYEDQHVIKQLQQQYSSYAAGFPIWSEHSTAMAQFAVWLALTEHNIGASLQHYGMLVEQQVSQEFSIPTHWSLSAQLVFGSIEDVAKEKTFIDDHLRFKTFD
ncbi:MULTISPECIES: nitroreductase family protein [unclassified Acinetobacter]|uniref:nitroreductase family protein n=1 Tax=unclassified Acinetobacter TaxID=196816 RepID=UPI0029346028|nr:MULTISPECIES: nitroreductase family protein [unclassified Acinetobacter]WOE32863.1 nitroreductase family protein [Acinetobacter sp. SAAs470]WOE38340.1 nitroreductase family protein [Acinetobacter sp. SAAs474]